MSFLVHGRRAMGPAYSFVILLIFSFGWVCLGEPHCVMIAPNILHVDNYESVYLEARGTNQNVPVTIQIYDFPLKHKQLFYGTLNLDNNNNHQAIFKVKVSREKLKRDLTANQYVYLTATVTGKEMHAVILVSFQSGYFFLQTDKPIYNPGEDVQYRIFTTDTQVKTVNRILTVQIKNPDGIIVEQNNGMATINGVFSKIYKVPEVIKEGTWSLEAMLKDQPEDVFSTQFDVKKHVLPTFEVTLKPSKDFFHVDDKTLDVELTARYLFGEDVQGFALVVFGVKKNNGEKNIFPSTLKRLELNGGTAWAKLESTSITGRKINDILGDLIYCRATVFTITGSEMVEAEVAVKVVKSPYRILFTKTSKYFKPGWPAVLHVRVLHQDGSPAKTLPLKANDYTVNTDNQGVALIKVNTATSDKQKTVKVETKDEKLPANHQAVEYRTLESAQAHSTGAYLHLGADVVVNNNVDVTIKFDNKATNLESEYISYLVVSKGQVIQANKWKVEKDSHAMKQKLSVTKDMLPSFRLVAYGILPGANYDILSDSVWVDMEDTCEGTLEVSVRRVRSSYLPGTKITLQVKGDPGAQVGMVIVDKAAFTLSKKGLLTQSKVWEAVEDRDMGCTKGGGQNNMAVFTDAGLTFTSNKGHSALPRQSHSCLDHVTLRNKRQATLPEIKLEFENRYGSDLQRKCCRDGMTAFPLDYSCEERSRYITEVQQCVEAFLHCCQGLQKKMPLFSTEWILARSDEFDIDESQIRIRSRFEVSFEWTTLTLGNNKGPDGLVTTELMPYLKDSITEWQVLAVSTSPTKGVCVAKPLPILVKKSFFVDLRLPYSVIVKEQVEIKVVLHNYMDSEGEFIVQLDKHDALCSMASAGGKFQQRVTVAEESSRVVHFTIIPLKEGSHAIRVRAFSRELEVSDGIQKNLLVLAEGEEKIQTTIRFLNVSARGGKRKETFVIPELTSQIPGTNSISIITVLGYGNHLQHRKSDGSYPPYGNLKSSTWVTAYTGKVFAMSAQFGVASIERVCETINFLIQQRQAPNGRFEEDAAVSSTSLMGGTKHEGVPGLTAFVLIAIAEAQSICSEDIPNLESSMSKATQYLLRELQGLSRPYSVALTSYALALRKVPKADLLKNLKRVGSSDGTHWGESGDVAMEATGYALLALLALNEFELATPVNNWLMERTNERGQFGSTQSTIVVFQALAEYKLMQVKEFGKKEKKLQVNLVLDTRSRPKLWTFDRNTWSAARTEKVHKLKNFTIEAEGSGTGKIVIETVYSAIPEQKMKSCVGYEMDVSIDNRDLQELQRRHNAEFPSGVKKGYLMEICLRIHEDTPETMTILDVSLPTGFAPSLQALEWLMNRVDHLIDFYSMDSELSRKGSLIIHLYKIVQGGPNCIPVVLYQEFEVGLLQPASVTVYSYYNKEKHCTKFYHPTGNATQLATICEGRMCICAEQACPTLSKHTGDRETKACSTTTHVYMVKLKDIKREELYDKYIMEIENIIKTGQDEVVKKDERSFLSHISCRKAMNLNVGSSYLVIGLPESMTRMPDGKYSYILSSDTWLEKIPSKAECQTDQKAICDEIQEFEDTMLETGCQN
ncbi:complement C3-like isoform X2 [Brienomyrus brachyistius]|uniref:complement C3-like isoform X2 n=1 Tax=Brienomyrus brachyistius TaxID=42636 RepID=UPI0020B31C93|nr:complement C3-like isoform X2 [Brienomyrus brachyistius]